MADHGAVINQRSIRARRCCCSWPLLLLVDWSASTRSWPHGREEELAGVRSEATASASWALSSVPSHCWIRDLSGSFSAGCVLAAVPGHRRPIALVSPSACRPAAVKRRRASRIPQVIGRSARTSPRLDLVRAAAENAGERRARRLREAHARGRAHDGTDGRFVGATVAAALMLAACNDDDGAGAVGVERRQLLSSSSAEMDQSAAAAIRRYSRSRARRATSIRIRSRSSGSAGSPSASIRRPGCSGRTRRGGNGRSMSSPRRRSTRGACPAARSRSTLASRELELTDDEIGRDAGPRSRRGSRGAPAARLRPRSCHLAKLCRPRS